MDNAEVALTEEVQRLENGLRLLHSEFNEDKSDVKSLLKTLQELQEDLQAKRDVLTIDNRCLDLQRKVPGVLQSKDVLPLLISGQYHY